MKVQVRVSPKVFIEGVGDTETDVFAQISSLQEVFGQFNKCGKCDCEDIRFVVREDSDENKYYELHCQNMKCRARLAFGQNKKGGGLYPRRKETKNQSMMGGKLEPGDYLPNNGWIRWNKQKQCNE